MILKYYVELFCVTTHFLLSIQWLVKYWLKRYGLSHKQEHLLHLFWQSLVGHLLGHIPIRENLTQGLSRMNVATIIKRVTGKFDVRLSSLKQCKTYLLNSLNKINSILVSNVFTYLYSLILL